MSTISSITPTTVSSGGRTIVEIIGAGFRLPTTPGPNAPYPVPEPPPSVRVFFGDVEALRVRVASATRLIVTTPAADPGVVDVRVVNVDDFGAPIDVALLPAGFTFARPELTTTSGDFSRLVRAFIRELKRQVIANVSLTSVVDYEEFPFAEVRDVDAAKLPAVYLTGPTLRPTDAAFVQTSPVIDNVGGTESIESRTPRTVDVAFGVACAADSAVVALNLVQALESFFVRTKYITMARDPNDAAAGTVSYELELEQDFGAEMRPNEDGVFSAGGGAVIRAFAFIDMPGMTGDLRTDLHPLVTEDVELGFYQIPPTEEG